ARAALSTRATWQTAIRTDEATRDATKTFVSGVKQGLLVAFAGHLDTLADFRLPARAQHVATPEERLAAAAKAKATRAARHTMGSKQKLPLRRGTSGIRPRFALRAASASSLCLRWAGRRAARYRARPRRRAGPRRPRAAIASRRRRGACAPWRGCVAGRWRWEVQG